ncbi:unnamed protein product [Phytophthora fragariaefolia]|uniref:ATP-dependent DNA helicase n=1 Tax=Phytophthora fragariaefolia TaxID=1490495 RepID=A0A9W7CQM3_9STRA|nr:unnamed protein product [Phytophthora fragariaefolia]
MERFYLRVLPYHRKGPQSFEHLRTVDGVTYETYRQAALRLGFLEDDAEWISCMREAAEFRMPYQLRQLFTTILVYSQVAEVRQLWERFYDDLSQDFAHRYRALLGQEKEDMIKFKTLKSLNDLLQISGYTVADFDIPQLHDFPALVLDSLMRNNLFRRELEGYDQNTLQAIVDQEDQLIKGQRAIFDEIIQAANDPDQCNKLFFIDDPGGTGKSTLLRHILAKVCLAGKIAIAEASSGIASLLLMGGRTAHSTFKIPLKLTNKSTCAIFKQSHLKSLIQRASLVIWDEAPMTHRGRQVPPHKLPSGRPHHHAPVHDALASFGFRSADEWQVTPGPSLDDGEIDFPKSEAEAEDKAGKDEDNNPHQDLDDGVDDEDEELDEASDDGVLIVAQHAGTQAPLLFLRSSPPPHLDAEECRIIETLGLGITSWMYFGVRMKPGDPTAHAPFQTLGFPDFVPNRHDRHPEGALRRGGVEGLPGDASLDEAVRHPAFGVLLPSPGGLGVRSGSGVGGLGRLHGGERESTLARDSLDRAGPRLVIQVHPED